MYYDSKSGKLPRKTQSCVNIFKAVSYTHLRAHETDSYLVCRLLLEKKKKERRIGGDYSGQETYREKDSVGTWVYT